MKRLLVFLLVCFSTTAMFAAGEHYQIDKTGCQFATKMTSVLMIDGVEQANPNLEIGVFDQDGICRGAKKPNGLNGRYFYLLQLWGPNSAIGTMTYTFRVWDHDNNCELPLVDDLQEVITYLGNANWQHNGANCSTSNPYPLNFTNPNGGIEKVINVDQWYLISSPVGTVDVADVNAMLDNTYDLYYFNQAPEINEGIGLEWINYRPLEAATDPEFTPQFTELVAGQGYLYANSGNGEQTTVTITFPGSAYEGENVTVDLDYSTANPVENMRGWNLVGNPFNMQATIGDYPFYRMTDGMLMADECTGAIEAMEGIFVHATAEDQNVTFAPYQSTKRAMLALNLTESGRLVDRAIVGFGQGRTLPKFQLNQNSSKVYVTLDNEDYAVVRSEGMGELPVSFKAEANGNYSLSINSEGVDFSYLHLIDNMTCADVDLLATPSYSFDARTTDYASRFRLVFATGSSADGDSFGFVNASGNLCIFGIEGEATLQVMDVTGRILSTETFSGSYEKQLNAASGVYMLRLTNGNNVKVQKMVVR